MGILPIELLNEVLHEERHHGLIGIGLGDAQVYVALLIKSGDHTDSRLNLFHLDAIVTSVRSPVHSPEVTHSEPSFIQRDVIKPHKY